MCVRLSSKGKAASQQKVREENKNGGSNNKYEAMQGTHVHTNIEGSLPSYGIPSYVYINNNTVFEDRIRTFIRKFNFEGCMRLLISL